MINKRPGFTIVELLIVIIVIAVLATIGIVAYNGVQSHTRDSVRKDAATKILKALELFYVDKASYPTVSSDSTSATFLQELKPYMGAVPVDPINDSTYKITYTYRVPNYILNNTTGCKSGDFLPTGMWYLAVVYESASSNPFPAGSGALATDQTRCGTGKSMTSDSTTARYFSPLLQRAN